MTNEIELASAAHLGVEPPRALEGRGRTELSVIWLHGMGQGPEHPEAVARRLALPEAGVRGVFPRAPAQSRSSLTGRSASSWFVQSIDRLWMVDLPSLQATETKLHALIDSEVERFGAGRVALAGFSQGAVTALYCGLRYRLPLAGIAVYAAFPLRGLDFFDEQHPVTASVPLWIGHGRRDWVVPFGSGEQVRDELSSRGHPVQWRRYRGGHEIFGGVGGELAEFFEGLKGHGS